MMNRSMGKARSSRKQRLDGARKGRAARPGNRVPRIVKARGAAVAVPANDTALEVRVDAEMVPANAVTPADVEGLDDQGLLAENTSAAPEELEIATAAADAAVDAVAAAARERDRDQAEQEGGADRHLGRFEERDAAEPA